MFQRFTNEDHLAVHKHKHEMTLKFGPARTDSVIIAGLFTHCTNCFFLLLLFKKIPSKANLHVSTSSMFMLYSALLCLLFLKKNTPKNINNLCLCCQHKVWRHLNYFCSISLFFLLLDQTPTPTRFLKNCEEVGLFNELASSFEQDEDDKRAKHSVRTLNGII